MHEYEGACEIFAEEKNMAEYEYAAHARVSGHLTYISALLFTGLKKTNKVEAWKGVKAALKLLENAKINKDKLLPPLLTKVESATRFS